MGTSFLERGFKAKGFINSTVASVALMYAYQFLRPTVGLF